ncbi:uncharacterized protein [Aegilops tauschii subsp. strangulata]|uniref:uncharacterized protein n=1 Tax=Aegilops tauschii subsp. strangulata TaxID=200361 RepID=UPI003CC85355
MPSLVSSFLRLIHEDGRRYGRRFHGLGRLRRFRRQAIRRADGRDHRGARRGARGAHHAPGQGRRATGRAHCGAPRTHGHAHMGLDPLMEAGPSAPMMNGAATVPRSPPGSPPPPPPPPATWLPPATPTPTGEAIGPSRGPPGYAPVPMRAIVDEEAALGFVSAPIGASGVIRLGVGMEEGAGVNSPPPLEATAGPSIRAEQCFGHLVRRAVAALDRSPGSWAPANLGFATTPLRQASTIAVSSSDEEGSSATRR